MKVVAPAHCSLIKQQGYQGKRGIVLNYLTRLRSAQGLPPRSRQLQSNVLVADVTAQKLTPRQATWLILRRLEKLGSEDKALIARLQEAHEELAEAITLAQDFATMLRERLVTQLENWLQRAGESASKAFRNFAKSLRRDYDAVKAALTEPWSTSPAEGHINRLKMLKRQMYGRAKLDLLEQRFLNAA
jgi:transposase